MLVSAALVLLSVEMNHEFSDLLVVLSLVMFGLGQRALELSFLLLGGVALLVIVPVGRLPGYVRVSYVPHLPVPLQLPSPLRYPDV